MINVPSFRQVVCDPLPAACGGEAFEVTKVGLVELMFSDSG